jgi:colicin import membrane protein
MRTFSQFMSLCEASDADAAKQLGWGGGASITRQGEGGRIGKERKKSEAERRRTKRGPGGTTVPAKPYKPRADIGQQRSSDTKTQAPTQERGSADVKAKAAAAAKAERIAAARARAAAKKSGETAPAAKPKSKDLIKQASALLSKKKPAASTSGPIERTTKREYTRDEKKKMVRAGKRLLSDLTKGRNLPASKYQP